MSSDLIWWLEMSRSGTEIFGKCARMTLDTVCQKRLERRPLLLITLVNLHGDNPSALPLALRR